MNQKILGFDSRLSPSLGESSGLWTGPRREQYLLNPDVQFPLSVDRHVWPSLFQFGNTAERSDTRTVKLTPSDFHQEAFRLWADLQIMRYALNRHVLQRESQICICLELCHNLASDERWAMAFAEPTNPATVEKSWRRLGIDVADAFFTSAVSNCALPAQEMRELRTQWQEELNADGLFSDFEQATAFKAFADCRIHAHAPFYLFSIYDVGVGAGAGGV